MMRTVGRSTAANEIYFLAYFNTLWMEQQCGKPSAEYLKRDKESIGKTDPETGFRGPQDLEESFAGEIVAFTAAD